LLLCNRGGVKLKSLDELQKIKEEALSEINLRENNDKKIKLVVGMGTCGIASGAREVLDAVLDEIAKRKLKDVTVTQTGCIGLCAQEPLMEVWESDGSKVMYGNLDGKKARQIVAQHVVNGIPVSEWIIN